MFERNRRASLNDGAIKRAQDDGAGVIQTRDIFLNKGEEILGGYQMVKTRTIPRLGQGGPEGIGEMVGLDTELTRSFQVKPPRSELWDETQNMEVEYAYFQPNLGNYQRQSYEGIAKAYTRLGFQNGVYGPENG